MKPTLDARSHRRAKLRKRPSRNSRAPEQVSPDGWLFHNAHEAMVGDRPPTIELQGMEPSGNLEVTISDSTDSIFATISARDRFRFAAAALGLDLPEREKHLTYTPAYAQAVAAKWITVLEWQYLHPGFTGSD